MSWAQCGYCTGLAQCQGPVYPIPDLQGEGGTGQGGGASCDDSHWVFDFGGTTNWVKLL